ncbi:MAG: hypothetical protein KDA92_23530, partial [Planctomycetales bacterium]|nr:hypothetical protein [Planctomycetales bacterium]
MPESERPTPASRPRTRRHETRWSVQLADHVSSLVITVGGIGTIVAVCLVFVLLLSVVLPLFHRAEVSSVTSTKLPEISAAQATLHAGVDEYRLIAWTVTPDGLVRSFRTDTGELLNEVRLTDAEHPLTAFSFQSEHGDFVAARENGTLQLGTIQFESRFLSPADLPDTIRNLEAQQIATHGQSVVQVTSQGQYREQALQVTLGEVVDLKGETLQHLSHTTASTGKIVVGINQAGQVLAAKLREKKNVLTRKVTWTVRVDMLPSPEISQPADRVLLTERGDNAFILNQRGELVRYMLNGESPQIAESLCVFPADDCLPSEQTADRAVVTSAAFALGGETLLIGDSHGGLRAWFTVRNRHAQTPDERWLLPVHELPQGAAAVTSLGISERSRMVAVGYADGELDVVHLTNDAKVLRVNAGQQPVDTVIMTPKDDGLLALAGNSLWQCELDPGYPEASFSSFFQPIWYEGYDRPEHVWQSSFAGVSSEMKLGLVPLIFGTMKATLYSLLFGVPIALLGAIYTSEFLSPRYRNRIKPLIETMASLPSVVLGFMGGLVIAPIVEQHVSSILVSFVFLPLSCLLGSFLWQHLPQRQAFRLANYRLFFVTLVLTAGGLASWRMGPIVE